MTDNDKADYLTHKIEAIDRASNLDSLKLLKGLRRDHVRAAELANTEPDGALLERLDEMIERLVGRLTDA